jgi:phosphate transport system substrate-binding protein
MAERNRFKRHVIVLHVALAVSSPLVAGAAPSLERENFTRSPQLCNSAVTSKWMIQEKKLMKMIRRLGILVVGAIVLALAAATSAQMLVNGAGATFPYPIYSKWFDDYAKVDPSVRFNYQSIGSGGGQRQILAQTVDFGASDGPMSDENLAKAPGQMLHIPTVAGAVVIAYNLESNPKLKLDGQTIVYVYMGKITKWNAPQIASQNAGVRLPNQDIIVVHRSDGSGTTYIFTSYLSAISALWNQEIGCNTSVKWPTGLGGKGNEGVAGLVKQTPGAIGFVELIYALQNKLAYADLRNASGNYVAPSTESVTAAMAAATVPDDFRFKIVNAPGAHAYPIAGATWLLVYKQQKDAAKGKKIVEFLKWALTEGEKTAKNLDYAPLPENLQKRVLQRIAEIRY